MPSKTEVEQYIKDNAIEAALAAAVSVTVKARPLDALAFLSQELAKAAKPVAPCFYTVYHTFVPDKAAAWWEQAGPPTPLVGRTTIALGFCTVCHALGPPCRPICSHRAAACHAFVPPPNPDPNPNPNPTPPPAR